MSRSAYKLSSGGREEKVIYKRTNNRFSQVAGLVSG